MTTVTMPSRLDDLVERCDSLLHDVRFQSVRTWKEQNPGRKAVGCMPVYFPRELIHSTGALPVGVMGGRRRRGDHPRGTPTTKATSATSHAARSR